MGAEYWRDALRFSSNAYLRLSNWQPSPLVQDYDERPANGWDIAVEGWLPAWPQWGAKAKFEQYYGDNVALFSRDDRQTNPSALGLSVNWTPIPFISLEAGHRMGSQGSDDSTVGLRFNYDFSRSFAAHFDADQVTSMRSLTGGRYDLVSRNNNIVLDYRQQTLLRLSMNAAVEGGSGETRSLELTVWAKYGVTRIEWQAADLIAAGGRLDQQNNNWQAVLPAYQPGGKNQYVVSAVAFDTQGNASDPAQTTITVNGSAVSVENSVFSIVPPQLAADGQSTAQAIIRLRSEDGLPVSGQAAKLWHEIDANAAQLKRLAREKSMEVGPLKEDSSQPGNYSATITAGTTPGVVKMTAYWERSALGHFQLTLEEHDLTGDEVDPASAEVTDLSADRTSAQPGERRQRQGRAGCHRHLRRHRPHRLGRYHYR